MEGDQPILPFVRQCNWLCIAQCWNVVPFPNAAFHSYCIGSHAVRSTGFECKLRREKKSPKNGFWLWQQPKFVKAPFVEPRWLPLCTCHALRRSSQVCLSDTSLVPHHQEGVFKTICLLGEFFHGLLLQLLYNSLGIKPPSLPPSVFYSPPLTLQPEKGHISEKWLPCMSHAGSSLSISQDLSCHTLINPGNCRHTCANMCNVSLAVKPK